MRLLRVELARLAARRIARVLAALAVAGLVVVLGSAAWRSHAPGPAEQERAAALLAQDLRMAPELAAQREECLAAQEKERATNPGADFGCDNLKQPQLSDYLEDPRFRFADSARGAVIGGALVLAMLAFLVGASFVGAEWQAGTLGNLLLFEPRRGRVLAAKAAALAAGVGAVGIVFMALDVGGQLAVSATRGDLTGTTAGLVRSVSLEAGRSVLLAVVAALAGYAIAGTLRHTAAAMGIAFGYLLAGELAIRAVWGRAEPWLLSNHVRAWLEGGVDVRVQQCGPAPGGGIDCGLGAPIHLSTGRGAVYVGVLLAVALLALLVTFRRRDVA